MNPKFAAACGVVMGVILSSAVYSRLFFNHHQTEFKIEKNNSRTIQEEKQFETKGCLKRNNKVWDTELMDTIQAERKSTLNEACRRSYDKDICPSEKTTINPRLLHSQHYKLSACDIPKCGYSSWLTAFFAIENKLDEYHIFAQQGIVIPKSEQLFRITRIRNEALRQKYFDESLKVILVRHPFSRLVSAFYDKLVPTGKGYSYLFGPISKKIYQDYRHLRTHNQSDDESTTFEDFANFIVRLDWFDMHWRTFRDLCHPCTSQYDYVAKFETLDNDMEYLKRKINLTEEHRKDFFPKNVFRTNSDLVKKTFESIPRELIYQLYEVYREDFEVFGYKMPEWMCRHN